MMRLPWYGRCAPHAVLDIIRGCNCRCRHCYNAAQPAKFKSLAELKEELSVIRRARNVTTITLSGGEPLLHPELEKIISWLHRDEGLTVCTLTNGIAFDDAKAGLMHDAGCEMVTLHIQEGQVRPDLDGDDTAGLRREKGAIALANGLFPALISTIEDHDREAFSDLADFLRHAGEYEYALVTIARKFSSVDPRIAQDDVRRDVMLEALASRGFVPACFVGGRFDRRRPRWYVFQSTQSLDGEGRETGWDMLRPGLLERVFLHGLALLRRRSVHWVPTSSPKLKARLLLNGLLGGRFSTFVFALKAVLHGWRLREKHVVVQLPPYSLGRGRVEICDNCPDATVRNGRLHPLCLNDHEEVPV